MCRARRSQLYHHGETRLLHRIFTYGVIVAQVAILMTSLMLDTAEFAPDDRRADHLHRHVYHAYH